MIFPKPKSVRAAMSPVIFACWMFGIEIIEHPIGHPRPVLSRCWSIVHFLIHSCSSSFAQVPEFAIVKDSILANHNYRLGSVSCTIFIVASMIIVQQTKILTSSNKRISLINESLNKFGVPVDYGITFKYQIIQLGLCFAQTIVISAVCYLAATNQNIDTQLPILIFWISAHYQLIFVFVVGCTYCSYIRYIGNRFQHLNACLLRSASNEGTAKPFLHDSSKQISTVLPIIFEIHGDLRLARAASRRWAIHVLRETRSIHRNLCIAARELNKTFGIPLILFMGISVSTITALLFSIYLSYVDLKSANMGFQITNMIPGSCWLIPYVMAVHHVIYCSSIASSEARRTGEVLHEMVKSEITNDVQSEINVFLLQLMQNPLEFTANGFFTLDYTLIRGIAGSVTTFLVIMVQMRTIYDLPVESTISDNLIANSTS